MKTKFITVIILLSIVVLAILLFITASFFEEKNSDDTTVNEVDVNTNIELEKNLNMGFDFRYDETIDDIKDNFDYTSFSENIELLDQSYEYVIYKEYVGNLLNDGIAAAHNDIIYFTSQQGNVFSMNSDGSEMKIIASGFAKDLLIIENYLVYHDYQTIRRINLENGVNEVLFSLEKEKDISEFSSNYRIKLIKGTSENLYFCYDTYLVALDFKELRKVVLDDDFTTWSVNSTSESIYYSVKNSDNNSSYDIVKFDIDSLSKTTVKQNIYDLFSFIVKGDKIYYLTRNSDKDSYDSDCKIFELHENQTRLVYEAFHNIHSMNIADNWLYFVRDDDVKYALICRINILNGEEEILPFLPTYRLISNDEWIELYDDERVYSSPISLNIVEDLIFYVNVYGRNGYLQYLKLDTD